MVEHGHKDVRRSESFDELYDDCKMVDEEVVCRTDDHADEIQLILPCEMVRLELDLGETFLYTFGARMGVLGVMTRLSDREGRPVTKMSGKGRF